MMTENEVLAWLERKGIKTRDEGLFWAYQYLRDYHNEAQKYNNALSWNDLERFFGKPIYYVQHETNRNCKARGWLILYELHTTEYGHFVVGENELQLKFEDCEFFRQEK